MRKFISCFIAAIAVFSTNSLTTEKFIAAGHINEYKVSDVKASNTNLRKSSASSYNSNQGSYYRNGPHGQAAGSHNNVAAAKADSLNYNHSAYASHKASGLNAAGGIIA